MSPDQPPDDFVTDIDFDDFFGPRPGPIPEPTVRFLHHNLKASSQLGLPDSPVIHLAVTQVANLLLPHAAGTHLSEEQAYVQALRAASGTVLEYLPIEYAIEIFKERVGLSMDDEVAERMYRSHRTNWLRQAKNAILDAGEHPGPDTSRSATRYGWQMPSEKT